jgi:RNA polymerase sigma factor (sigma-70 family)
MSENKKYTIIVRKQRVEVSEAVYRAYHKEREAERYQNKLIRQNELSLERFRDDGVNIDYLIVRVQPDIVDKLIHQEKLEALWSALQSLSEDERSLIDELFFNEKSERELSAIISVPQKTINDRKKRILLKLRRLIEN